MRATHDPPRVGPGDSPLGGRWTKQQHRMSDPCLSADRYSLSDTRHSCCSAHPPPEDLLLITMTADMVSSAGNPHVDTTCFVATPPASPRDSAAETRRGEPPACVIWIYSFFQSIGSTCLRFVFTATLAW